jgi:hypothetical protein
MGASRCSSCFCAPGRLRSGAQKQEITTACLFILVGLYENIIRRLGSEKKKDLDAGSSPA